MPSYQNHSKFAYKDLDQIQQDINNGVLNAFDFVICKDSHEFILITEDLSLMPIKSKIYRFLDTQSAETTLNEKSDTYEGQLVSILSNRGTYEAYIVNRNIKGHFYVSPLNAYSGSVDYDTLQHQPITNLTGDISSPIILENQKDGIYKVNGIYKISNNLDTVFSSVNNNLFIVSNADDGTVYVKKIGSDEIIDYTINESTITSAVVPTTQWLESQGYITEKYVDKKLEALGIITQKEVEDYVQNIVLATIDNTVDQRIEIKLGEKFEATTEREIVDIFIKK